MSDYIDFLTDTQTQRIISGGTVRRIHFVGVLGAGMLPLSKLTLSFGYSVSGSDARLNCEKSLHGIRVMPHFAQNVHGKDLVVASFAIGIDNPEICEARRLGIPIASRACLLGAMMLGYNTRIGISGSHGKSTTTAIIDKILCDAGMMPTTLSGASLYDGKDLRIGGRESFVYEACEYRDAFLSFHPTYQVITGIELDHTDYFDGIASLQASFRACAERASGAVILCADFEGSSDFAASLSTAPITYGRAQSADFRYEIEDITPEACSFFVLKHDKILFKSSTTLIGEYNLKNITAAAALADTLGIDPRVVGESVASFPGIFRRMSRLGSLPHADLLYDYAHHPTEISNAIDAIKARYGSCTVVFRPHTYSRTASLWNDFVASLGRADSVMLLDIYPARESPIDGITSEDLARDIGSLCTYCKDIKDVANMCAEINGAVVIMGAGDVDELVSELVQKCKKT